MSVSAWLADCAVVSREMTHKLFAQQGGRGVSLDRFRTFLKRLQEGLLKLEFAHYDLKGTLQPVPSIFAAHLSSCLEISMQQTAGQQRP